jgi:hypothetical protein
VGVRSSPDLALLDADKTATTPSLATTRDVGFETSMPNGIIDKDAGGNHHTLVDRPEGNCAGFFAHRYSLWAKNSKDGPLMVYKASQWTGTDTISGMIGCACTARGFYD